MKTSTLISATILQPIKTLLLCTLFFCGAHLACHAQFPASEGEANHPSTYQKPVYQVPGGTRIGNQYFKRKRKKRKSHTSSDFSNLLVNVTHTPGYQAGYLVTVSFESRLRAYLHVNVLNKKNRVTHSEVFTARAGKNLLLLDVENLLEGNYRILISSGNQYLRSGFIKI